MTLYCRMVSDGIQLMCLQTFGNFQGTDVQKSASPLHKVCIQRTTNPSVILNDTFEFIFALIKKKHNHRIFLRN